jgi:hypothetical protein
VLPRPLCGCLINALGGCGGLLVAVRLPRGFRVVFAPAGGHECLGEAALVVLLALLLLELGELLAPLLEVASRGARLPLGHRLHILRAQVEQDPPLVPGAERSTVRPDCSTHE